MLSYFVIMCYTTATIDIIFKKLHLWIENIDRKAVEKY